ncbi:MAG: creatininase family protein, partial [Halobacteria archaeon]|nr:creatininase family protein [Halobacteria archaeon]
PPVNVGVSEEHRGFDGTLYVSPDTFRSYVGDILESASRYFDNAVVVNGHGGNIDALDEVCARLYRDDTIFATEWTWWNALSLNADMGHAGELETSLVMYLEPDTVDEADEAGVESWGEFVNSAPVAYDTDEFTQNGVVGDPRQATAEKGERIFEDSVANLVELVEWVDENR